MGINKARGALGFIRMAGLGLGIALLLSACSPGGFDFGPANGGGGGPDQGPQTLMTGKTLGSGPVKVALLLPLFLFTTAVMFTQTFNPFLYFQF